MGVRQRKVAVHDLQVAEFVSELDRPWHQTPFPIQGFYIRSQEEIRSLISYCKWVYVDIAEGRDNSEYEATNTPIFAPRNTKGNRQQEVLRLPPIQIRNAQEYPVSATMKKELKHGNRLMVDVDAAYKGIAKQLRERMTPNFAPVVRMAQHMTFSVVRNPDALLWLVRIREHDDYSYRHSLNACVWALVCGRQIGLEPEALKSLALGTMLSHVGKLDLPQSLITNEQMLAADDYEHFKSYIARGVERLQAAGMPRSVINIVQYQRERHNGSGFPRGVAGDRIPLLAKVAGLVDYYETLVETRQSQVPLTPAQAVAHLYERRNTEFQADLVERFIQAIGIYPAGTLVELSDGHRGAVISHSSARRLWPRVMLMTDQQQRPLKQAKIINLAEINEGKDDAEAVKITGCLPYGTQELDPRDYEVTGSRSRWCLKNLVG